MIVLLLQLLSLFMGYLFMIYGPALFSRMIATLVIAHHAERVRRVDARLLALGSQTFWRRRNGEVWARVSAEQRLLDVSLKLALGMTELSNQYLRSSETGEGLAARRRGR